MDLPTLYTVIGYAKDFLSLIREEKNNNNPNYEIVENKTVTFINNLTIIKEEQETKEAEKFNTIQARLKTLFNSHGIPDLRIAPFLKENIDDKINIPISDYENLIVVFNSLTNEHLEKISSLFGINKGWLFGDEYMYPSMSMYNDVKGLLRFYIEKKRTEKIEALAIRQNEFDYEDKHRNQPLFFLFRTPITELFEATTIYRYYYPVGTYWKWNYWKDRYDAKALFYLSDTMGTALEFKGKTISEKEMGIIKNKKSCPHVIIQTSREDTWPPHDYANDPSKNQMAKETEEFGSIMDYIEEKGYKTYLDKLTKV